MRKFFPFRTSFNGKTHQVLLVASLLTLSGTLAACGTSKQSSHKAPVTTIMPSGEGGSSATASLPLATVKTCLQKQGIILPPSAAIGSFKKPQGVTDKQYRAAWLRCAKESFAGSSSPNAGNPTTPSTPMLSPEFARYGLCLRQNGAALAPGTKPANQQAFNYKLGIARSKCQKYLIAGKAPVNHR